MTRRPQQRLATLPQDGPGPGDPAGGPSRRAWASVLVPLGVLFFCYTYNDNVITTLHGMNLWSALRDGELLRFYSYNEHVTPTSSDFHTAPISYGFGIYLVFAVWNLPLWLLQELGGVNVFESVLCLAWAKAITLPFLAGCAWSVGRICETLGVDRARTRWARLMFLTSGLGVAAVFVMGQYDVIHLFVTLLGLDLLLRGRYRLFLLCVAGAVALKLFPLFVFLPVLLLREKRYLHVLAAVATAASLTVALKIPFLWDTDFSSEPGDGLIRAMLLANPLPLGITGAPAFALLFGLLCIACHVARPEPEHLPRHTLYVAFVGVALFFLATPAYPYWFVMLTPFVALLWALSAGRGREVVVLDLALVVVTLLIHQIVYSWCYDLTVVRPMALAAWLAPVDDLAVQMSPAGVYAALGLTPLLSLMTSVFAATLIALMVLTHPRVATAPAPIAGVTRAEQGALLARAYVGIAMCAIPAGVYLYTLAVHGTAGP